MAAGNIVDVCAFYNSDERRNIVVVAEASGKLHEIYWKESTVGIEAHSVVAQGHREASSAWPVSIARPIRSSTSS